MPDHQVVVKVVSGRTQLLSRTFTPGEPIPQFSVGSSGDWIVSGPGVAPQHLLLTFDGQQLHAASVEDAPPVFLKGAPLDKNWNPVPALGELQFGQASLLVLLQPLSSAAGATPTPRPASGPHNTQFFEDYQAELEHKQGGARTRFLGPLADSQHARPPGSVVRPAPQAVIVDVTASVPAEHSRAALASEDSAHSAHPPPLLNEAAAPPVQPQHSAAPFPAPQVGANAIQTVAAERVAWDIVQPNWHNGGAPDGVQVTPLPPGGQVDSTTAPTTDAAQLAPAEQFPRAPGVSATDDDEPFSTVYAGDELRDFVAQIPPLPLPDNPAAPVAGPNHVPGASSLPDLDSQTALGPESAATGQHHAGVVSRPRGGLRWSMLLLVLLPLLLAVAALALAWFFIIAR